IGLVPSGIAIRDGRSQRHCRTGSRSPVTPWNRKRAMTSKISPTTPPSTPSRIRHRNLERKRHQSSSKNEVLTTTMAVAMLSVLALPSIELPHPNNRARRHHQDDRDRPPAHGPTRQDSGRMVFFLV